MQVGLLRTSALVKRSSASTIKREIECNKHVDRPLFTRWPMVTRGHKHASARLKDAPSLSDFIRESNSPAETSAEELVPNNVPYLDWDPSAGKNRSVFVETYGCQMNVSDTEIVYSIMNQVGFQRAKESEDADVIFLNTCAIRDHAEHKIWTRLGELRARKVASKNNLVVGVLGCMAERLKEKLLDEKKIVDIVAGPDSYRDLPRLLSRVSGHKERAMNVMLSADETYADISPVREDENGISAYVSIMRGCNNMCTYCIVPFTRGRERSRPARSIEEEVRALSAKGYKEVVLLGQNVNSYNDMSEVDSQQPLPEAAIVPGFSTVYKRPKAGVAFTELMDRVSSIDPEMRIRFTSPHPKDFPDQLLKLISERPNICKQLHMPAQSGSTSVLERMRRGYTREAYISLIDRVREIAPTAAISSDFISGFCGETEEEHKDTISLLEYVKFDQAFMFAYSMREKTPAHRKFTDDVPDQVKKQRLQEVINTFNALLKEKTQAEIGKLQLVLVEGTSRRSDEDLSGRSDANKKVVFNNKAVPGSITDLLAGKQSSTATPNLISAKPGDYVVVKVNQSTGATLVGEPVARTTLQEFHRMKDLLGEL